MFQRPTPLTWLRGSDARVGLAAGYALLLQVAHPTVGAGVSSSLEVPCRPVGAAAADARLHLHRSPTAAEQAAAATGRRIRAMHSRIEGALPDGCRYSALEPEAYAWVHATLAEGIFAAHERFGRPLVRAEREQLWAQWRALGPLLRIGEDVPACRLGRLSRLFAEMTERRLEHTARGRRSARRPGATGGAPAARGEPPALAARTRTGAAPGVARHLRPARALAARALRDPLARGHGAELRLAGALLRSATPVMPSALLVTGPDYLRWRSAGGGRSAPPADAGAGNGAEGGDGRRSYAPRRDQ